MNKNVGTIDKIVRLAIAVVCIALIAMGQVSGVLAIVLGAVAAIMVLTSLMSWCPIWVATKMSTRGKSAE